MSGYSDWCNEHGCTHGHCPRGCEHPQPANYAGTKAIICGACYFGDGQVVPVEPCVPATCRDA